MKNINFASGPCAKPPHWKPPKCEFAGRSHRSKDGLAKIQEILNLQRKILKIPNNYFIGIVAGSTTGAMETLLWSLLGARGIDVLNQCIFSNHWANDIVNELKIADVKQIKADFPLVADVTQVDFRRDVVFCWSSTTSGVCYPNQDWIKSDRKGLTICDATSAAFIVKFDWSKFDAMAFSWQKGLGGEAGFGMIVLSPRAIERLENYKPSWPVPRIFRIAQDKRVNFKIFEGHTINTPSMICIEDFCNCLKWAEGIGGIDALVQRVSENYATAEKWISGQKIFKFLVDKKCRAPHIICLDLVSEKYQTLSEVQKWEFLKNIVKICAKEKIGNDILGHVLTKPHIRVWAGPTIESADLENLLIKLTVVVENCLKNL